jgi:Effector protein
MDPIKKATPPLHPPSEKKEEGLSKSPIEKKTEASAKDVLPKIHEPQEPITSQGDPLNISSVKREDQQEGAAYLIAKKQLIGAPELALDALGDENDPDIDEDMEQELDRILTENLCEIPPDSPFIDTDLIILKDEYSGHMPINSIKEKDFKEITVLFDKICAGESKIQIADSKMQAGESDDESDEEESKVQADEIFSNKAKEAIKMLLTREIGRKLIKPLCNDKKTLYIERGQICAYTSESNYNRIMIDLEDTTVIELHPSGKNKISAEQPLHLSLGHELVHAVHALHDMDDDDIVPPTMEKNYDNIEEQRTITGLKQDLLLNTDNADPDSWEPINHEDYYDELNERNLTAAFTGGQNVWYPRVGHHGVHHGASDRKRKDIPIKERIIALIEKNILWDLEKLLEDKTINLKEILSPQSALIIALQGENPESLQFFIKIDPDSVNTKSEGTTPFLVAVQLYKNIDHSKYFHILNVLHEAKSDINAVDDKGNSALHYMVQNDDKEGMKKFFEWGGDPQLKNGEGQTAIEVVFEKIGGTLDIGEEYGMKPSTENKVAKELSNACEYVQIFKDKNYLLDRLLKIGERIHSIKKDFIVDDEKIKMDLIKNVLKLENPEFTLSFLKLLNIEL